MARVREHQTTGILLLLDHYKVPDGPIAQRVAKLAIMLGEAHVPYFQAPRKPGIKVDHKGYLSLILDVRNARRPNDRGDIPALRRLLSSKGYKHYARGKDGEEALRKRLQRARKDRFVGGVLGTWEAGKSREELLELVSR